MSAALTTGVIALLGLMSVGAGVAVFRVASMVRSAFWLLASFLAVGGILIVLHAHFLGIILILMLVGEMVIMAVFMVMYMMNPAGLMAMSMVHNRRGSLTVAAVTFALLVAGALTLPWPERAGRLPADATVQLGLGLFRPKMLVMMTLAVALFAAIVAGLALATAKGRYDRLGDDLDGPDPDR